MQIRLENIGIIKNSTITLDGLTVITGKNNSGKTTVGKTLYALLDAVSNIRQKALSDRRYYIRKQLEKARDILDVFRYVHVQKTDKGTALFENYPALGVFVSGDYRREGYGEDIEKYAHDLVDELTEFDVGVLREAEERHEFLYYGNLRKDFRGDQKFPFFKVFEKQRSDALAILEQMLQTLEKDSELVDYARESINQTLRMEFSGQIQPVRTPVSCSKIELSEAETVYFDLTIAENHVVNNGIPVFWGSPYRKVYFIDDPFVLDDLSGWRMYRDFEVSEMETILNPNRIGTHNRRLKSTLRSGRGLNVFEQTVLDESLKRVREQIDQIIPGTFLFSSEGEYYVQNGTKLKLSNLATGSKMFSIVKILLEKGELDSDTMLILDEPEAHLHPQWQNAFAEMAVLLVKELDVNILLTTHSPNFMLALDANMRKYGMAEKTNFYQTDIVEDGFVQYHCVNDDMGKIYQDFLQYLSEAKMPRSKYLYDIGE